MLKIYRAFKEDDKIKLEKGLHFDKNGNYVTDYGVIKNGNPDINPVIYDFSFPEDIRKRMRIKYGNDSDGYAWKGPHGFDNTYFINDFYIKSTNPEGLIEYDKTYKEKEHKHDYYSVTSKNYPYETLISSYTTNDHIDSNILEEQAILLIAENIFVKDNDSIRQLFGERYCSGGYIIKPSYEGVILSLTPFPNEEETGEFYEVIRGNSEGHQLYLIKHDRQIKKHIREFKLSEIRKYQEYRASIEAKENEAKKLVKKPKKNKE